MSSEGSTVSELLQRLTQAAVEDQRFPRKTTPTNTFSGTGNVNIVCQTLVIGSLQELVDGLRAQEQG